jgi:hypothetical protein
MASEYHATREAARTAMMIPSKPKLALFSHKFANYGSRDANHSYFPPVSGLGGVERRRRVIMVGSHG